MHFQRDNSHLKIVMQGSQLCSCIKIPWIPHRKICLCDACIVPSEYNSEYAISEISQGQLKFMAF